MVSQVAEMVEQVVITELPRWIAAHPALRARLQSVLARDAPAAPLRMTYAEFLEWANEDTLAEWTALPHTDEGMVVMTSPASNRHQKIARFLITIMSIYVETQRLGIVLPAPFQMKLEHGREPDLLFVSQANLIRLHETYLNGPADLVVEIVSPESAERDRGAKFYEYARGGVLEYWLLDPRTQWAEFYQLGELQQYEIAFAGREGLYNAHTLPGFWLQIEWLWQDPLPNAEATLWEIVGTESVLRRLMQRVGLEELQHLLGKIAT